MSDINAFVDFHLEHPTLGIPFDEAMLKLWISEVCNLYGKTLGSVNYILTTDEAVYEINVEHLNHDYYTDIITFQLEEDIVEGDIFISLDQISQNAADLEVSYETEFLRVVIHGILHMIGFMDKTEEDSIKMRQTEDDNIQLFYTLAKERENHKN